MRGRGVGADSLHGPSLKAARHDARQASRWGKAQPAARGRRDEVTRCPTVERECYTSREVWRITYEPKPKRPPAQAKRAHSGGKVGGAVRGPHRPAYGVRSACVARTWYTAGMPRARGRAGGTARHSDHRVRGGVAFHPLPRPAPVPWRRYEQPVVSPVCAGFHSQHDVDGAGGCWRLHPASLLRLDERQHSR